MIRIHQLLYGVQVHCIEIFGEILELAIDEPRLLTLDQSMLYKFLDGELLCDLMAGHVIVPMEKIMRQEAARGIANEGDRFQRKMLAVEGQIQIQAMGNKATEPGMGFK